MAGADYLEEYISAMETRSDPEPSDLQSQLAQKEKDLMLAAELGKALLEKNETLSRENERMAEEYSKHLEELAQEKHSLARKMSVMESEYEAQMAQFQIDLQNTRKDMESEHDSGKTAAKERSRMISELTEQNQRLTRQLRDAIKNEEQLNLLLQQMRNQQDARRTNLNEHVSHMEVMNDEVNLLNERRHELERRIDSLTAERYQLSQHLEEAADRIACLEREKHEHNTQLRLNQRQLSQMNAVNSSLSERLEAASRHSSPSTAPTSLMNELDVSADEGISSGSHHLLSQHKPRSAACASAATAAADNLLCLLDLDDDDERGRVENDLPLLLPPSDADQLRQFKKDVYSVLLQMRTLNERARPDRASCGGSGGAGGAGTCNVSSLDTDSSEDVPLHNVKVGMLQEVFAELQARVHDLLRPRKSACEVCGRETPLQLEIDLHGVQEKYDQLEKRCSQQAETLKKQADELARNMQQLTIMERQHEALKEERDILKDDLSNTHLSKEDLIKKAWETRDQAVQRKNATEVELAKSRIDVMQINSQLLESIQQKVELSCQLDQWQSDMQQLLEEQMRRKLTQTEHLSDSDSSTGGGGSSTRHKKSILAIFNRAS